MDPTVFSWCCGLVACTLAIWQWNVVYSHLLTVLLVEGQSFSIVLQMFPSKCWFPAIFDHLWLPEALQKRSTSAFDGQVRAKKPDRSGSPGLRAFGSVQKMEVSKFILLPKVVAVVIGKIYVYYLYQIWINMAKMKNHGSYTIEFWGSNSETTPVAVWQMAIWSPSTCHPHPKGPPLHAVPAHPECSSGSLPSQVILGQTGIPTATE